MSVREVLEILGLALLVGPAWATPTVLAPAEPQESGTLLLAGRLPWGASSLPTGEILAPCEDQTLSVLDDRAQVLGRWKAPARIAGPVTVGPRSAYQLLAVPLGSGRVEVLVWDSKTKVLASSFGISHEGEVAATAWSASGSVSVAWKSGAVEQWASHGEREWATQLPFAACQLLRDDAGLYVFGPGQVNLLSNQGQILAHWTVGGTPGGVLETLDGNVYVWTDAGLWVKKFDEAEFTLFDRSPQILGVVVDRLGRLLVTEPTRLRRINPQGTLLSVTVLPRPAVTGSVLDDRGRVLVGTSEALEAWTYDGRLLSILSDRSPAAGALLTDRGLGVWGTSDWKVHIWTGFRWPPFGWPELGGGPGHPFSARRPASMAIRSANWSDNPEFGYFFQLAASGEEAKQREVLDRFEAEAAQGDLLGTWPFANVVLLKLGRSGLTDLVLDRNRVVNNWPELRLRAFGLLAQTAGPEDRDELIALLEREFDPSVVTAGIQALTQSGWDGDGKIMRLLAGVQARMPDQVQVADAVIDAARSLWVANGKSSDPSLLSLVSAVFQGPYPRSIKQKAQKLFQDLVEGP